MTIYSPPESYLSKEIANKVWDILVKYAGVSEDGRMQFLQSVSDVTEKYPAIEYRFGGKLGFGGKFWKDKMKVTCYSEDEKGKKGLINKINKMLSKLTEE